MCSEGNPDTVNMIHTAAPLPPKHQLGEWACDPDMVSMAQSLRAQDPLPHLCDFPRGWGLTEISGPGPSPLFPPAGLLLTS